MTKCFLKTQDVLFLDRPKMAAGKHTTYDYSDILWTPYGAYRRRRLASFEHIRADEIRALMRRLFKASATGCAVHINRD
jgi:typhasterol/6-deoxotyphasterol 2alpha-hydroxylase